VTQSITASVGQDGKNARADVAMIQTLLFWLPPAAGGLGQSQGSWIDGVIGDSTIGAIRRFQQTQFGIDDGLVQPSDFTIRRLNALIDGEHENRAFTDPISLKASVVSRFGQPMGTALGTEPVTDGVGIMGHFELGDIIHHPGLGAFQVLRPILDEYNAVGGPEGAFGYPISDEREWLPRGKMSHFQFRVDLPRLERDQMAWQRRGLRRSGRYW
jgi:hypothetical protein